MTSPWVRPTEAAEILGIPRKTLYRQIEQGIIPRSAVAPRLPGTRSILISRKWLNDETTTNVTAFPQAVTLSDSDINRIADAVIARLFPASIQRAS